MGDDNASLTLVDAARATGVDRRTLRRQIDDGTFPGAYREETARGPDTGSWRVPIADLAAAGHTVAEISREPRAARSLKPAEAALEIEALRAELAEERTLRLVAEAVAEERSAALKDARLALRAIANAAATPDEVRDVDSYEPGPRLPKPRGHWLR